MAYDCPHRVTSRLRGRSRAAVDRDFRALVPGRCLDTGVRHFMLSLGIRAEGGGVNFLSERPSLGGLWCS
jgi:hypothetical protein